MKDVIKLKQLDKAIRTIDAGMSNDELYVDKAGDLIAQALGQLSHVENTEIRKLRGELEKFQIKFNAAERRLQRG